MAALRIVFEECRYFRRADDSGDGILEEAILLALGDRGHTKLKLSPTSNPVIEEVHADGHDTKLVPITGHNFDSVAIFQKLASDARVALLDLVQVGARKGLSITALSTIIDSQHRTGTMIA